MPTLCFFDLETKKLYRDVYPDYEKLSFTEKKRIQRSLTPKLGLATACIISEGSKSEVFSFDEGQESELIKTLESFDAIVGHNVLDFDYLVLSPYFPGDIVEHFLPKTTDTLVELKRVTDRFIGLDDLAKNNLGLQKTLETKTVPALWCSGQKDVVRQYCKHDVELLKDIYFLGKQRGTLKYTMKEYGVVKGIGETPVPW